MFRLHQWPTKPHSYPSAAFFHWGSLFIWRQYGKIWLAAYLLTVTRRGLWGWPLCPPSSWPSPPSPSAPSWGSWCRSSQTQPAASGCWPLWDTQQRQHMLTRNLPDWVFGERNALRFQVCFFYGFHFKNLYRLKCKRTSRWLLRELQQGFACFSCSRAGWVFLIKRRAKSSTRGYTQLLTPPDRSFIKRSSTPRLATGPGRLQRQWKASRSHQLAQRIC